MSGIRNIRKLSKEFDTATGYYHADFDGVCSAVWMKAYLEDYGIRTIKAIPINYGDAEFSAEEPLKGTLNWMVDFANSKPFLHIHTDHHDRQLGVVDGVSTAFMKSPSNATALHHKTGFKDYFAFPDIEVVSIVDSANYAVNGITVDEVMKASFKLDKTVSVARNHFNVGLALNKVILANKNKKGFLERLVMESSPSIFSMYNTMMKIIHEGGFKTPEYVDFAMDKYLHSQTLKKREPYADIKSLRSGEYTMWGRTIVQFGGGDLYKAYDRYVPFKMNPDADYLIMGWDMGLIQVSKNPFKMARSEQPLRDVVLDGVLKQWWHTLVGKRVTFGQIKGAMEAKTRSGSMGYTFDDFVNTFKQEHITGVTISSRTGHTDFVRDVSLRRWRFLSQKQRSQLDRISVSLWDLVFENSGGHMEITNIQGLSFWGDGHVDTVMRPLMGDIANDMKSRPLIHEWVLGKRALD